MKRLLLLSLLVLVFAACQTPDTAEPVAGTPVVSAVDTEADRTAIEAMTADYTAAVQVGDPAAVSALHADDAILHPPNEPSISGREAIDAYFTRIHAEPVDLTYATDDVVVSESGDLAYEVGTWDGGKYLTVYRRTPSGWKIVADSWSNDAPPTPTD
jgi:ketosteroid isomerase-like protein